MAVYVDKLAPCIPNPRWRWNESCHLFADSTGELCKFAAAIGLRRSWLQPGGRHPPHYDLTAGKRAAAIRRGAVEIGRRQVVGRIRKWREEQDE